MNSSDVHFLQNKNSTILPAVCTLFFIICLVSIVCVTVGVVMYPSLPLCNNQSANHTKWFHDAVFYEIFPASFQDTDGDGFGDFQGIISHLNYLQSLGVTAIRLNSVFCALDYPLEYEHVIDLRNVDPHLGRIEDFRRMVREIHRRNMRVILDMNPTITSDQHTWALHWQRGIPGYEHFYASANRSKDPPEMEDDYGLSPEDLELTQRTFGGHYVLNWSNPSVQEEYRKTLEFWVDQGVDGFYMKHIDKMHIIKQEDKRAVLKQWRAVLDQPGSNNHVLMIYKTSIEESIVDLVDLLDMPLHIEFNDSFSLKEELRKIRVAKWRAYPKLPWIVWHLGSVDTFRFGSRIENHLSEAAFQVLTILPGPLSVFYGDEIGAKDSYNPYTGNVFRGGQLVPMQWTADNATGSFTTNGTEPWLPLSPDHQYLNVQTQQQRVHDFINLIKLRNKYHSWHRDYKILTKDQDLFILQKIFSLNAAIVVCANLDDTPQTRNFEKLFDNLKILSFSSGINEAGWNPYNFTLYTGDSFIAETKILRHRFF